MEDDQGKSVFMIANALLPTTAIAWSALASPQQYSVYISR